MWQKVAKFKGAEYFRKALYVRMLFIDYSPAFNIIVPSKLITKLRNLGLNTSLCNWILDILTGRPHVVSVGNNLSTSQC